MAKVARMSLIIFSHANSFPASTYRVLFEELSSHGFKVAAVDRFGHDPNYPVTSNWPHLVRQLADFAHDQMGQHAGDTWLVGHSLGGFLSVMCAARHPLLDGRGVNGIVLLDAPLLGGWRARTLGLVKLTQLVGSVSPGRISRKRRYRWPDIESVRQHFQAKRAFAHWDARVLDDYACHGTHDDVDRQGRPCRTLSFDRDVETRIYDTLPHNLDRLLRRHPLSCPVGFVGGTRSREMRQVGLSMTRRVVGTEDPERLRFLEGSHLFPMEKPAETAQAVTAIIDRLAGQRGSAQR
jgi:pimeloyl-ACP methyl ester carboxylesterase